MAWPDQLWVMWLELITGVSPAGWLVALAATIAAGVALGHLRIAGVSLGVTTVIFAAIAYAWVLWTPDGVGWQALVEAKAQQAIAAGSDPAAARAAVEQELHARLHSRREVLEFLREFGLVLFVYCIGMMVGPGFLPSLKARGLRWNLFAVAVVLGGLAVTSLAVALLGLHPAAAVGVMSGAITNTPGWAAAQATLRELSAPAELLALTVSGYAVAYPCGIAGIIGSLIAVRVLFAIRPREEAAACAAQQGAPATGNINLRVTNPGLVGRTLAELERLGGEGVVISRLQRGDEQLVPQPAFVLAAGDRLHAVGSPEALERLAAVVGERIDEDLREAPARQRLLVREVLLTNQELVGERLGDLGFPALGATVTRIRRHGRELVADDRLDLHFADRLVVVGDEAGIRRVEQRVGNAPAILDQPQLIGLFVGIAIGIVLGQIPIPVPGLAHPVKLGLAGGPIVAALVCSAVGHLGKHIIFHVGRGANNLMREFGIAVFLACVGLLSAPAFVEHAFSAQGAQWMLVALAIAMLPLLAVGIAARWWWKENYTTLMGVMAGSCTDPPALAYANAAAGSELPGLAYATVYPLTMILRIVGAQLFVLLWLAP